MNVTVLATVTSTRTVVYTKNLKAQQKFTKPMYIPQAVC
jgi:hypothetical protein